MPSSRTRPFARLVALASLPFLSPALFAETEILNGVPVEVLARTTVQAGDWTLTYVRIRPPVLPAAPAAPAPSPAPDPAALAEAERLAAKTYVNWQPTILVHLRPPVVSELRFELGGRPVTVWSNVDFRALLSVSHWETATAVYDWQPVLSETDAEDDVRPANLNLSPGPAEYLVEATAADLAGHEADLAQLDSLLAYHELHREALLAEQVRREARATELARQAAEAAAKPKSTTIYFWKNENPAPTP